MSKLWALALVLAGCDVKAEDAAATPRGSEFVPDLTCDAPCSPGAGASCCTEFFNHGSGAKIGWLRRGDPIPVSDADPDVIVLEFKRWLASHAAVAGLAPMTDMIPLEGLTRWATPPQEFRALSTIRLHQNYRGAPVFGAGETVTLTVSQQHGIVAAHGAIADPRETYAGWDQPMGSEAALAAAAELLEVLQAEDVELDPVSWTVAEPTLVAVVEIEAMAYSMPILKNGTEVGTLALRADNGAMLGIFLNSAEALPDPAPVEVRGRTFSSDTYALADAGKQFVTDFTQLQGEPLVGSVYMPLACQEDPEASPQCGETRLGNLEVAVVDALGQKFDDKQAIPHVPTHPDGKFLAQPPASTDDPVTPETRAAALQDAFYRLLATIRLFAPFKAGRWDSFWYDDSGFKAAFVPRLAFFFDAPGCEDGAPGCAGVYYPYKVINDEKTTLYDEHPWVDLPPHRPPDGPDEAMGSIIIGVEGFRSIDVLFHEYGHVLDSFSSPYMIGHKVVGSGCKGLDKGEACQPACQLDTTDESEPLKETFADMMGIFAIGRLYTGLTYDNNCGAVSAIASSGKPAGVHSPTCIDHPGEILSFLDERPNAPGYFPTDDGPIPTGKCSKSLGYRQGALVTAWWEWIHGNHCAVEAPFTCQSFGEESFGASTGVEAMFYALSLTNQTSYRQFFTDAETYLQCMHGDSLGNKWREVWCHHGGLECEALPSVCPAICGDGVAEGDEACDQSDMSDQTCESLGLGSGALRCHQDCTLDTSECGPAPTTGEVPTTGGDPAPDPGSSSGSSGPAPDSATASGGGVSTDDGCGCAATPSSGAWLLGLVPLLLRRRRRARLDTLPHAQ